MERRSASRYTSPLQRASVLLLLSARFATRGFKKVIAGIKITTLLSLAQVAGSENLCSWLCLSLCDSACACAISRSRFRLCSC
jgi:hypothetical protein